MFSPYRSNISILFKFPCFEFVFMNYLFSALELLNLGYFRTWEAAWGGGTFTEF